MDTMTSDQLTSTVLRQAFSMFPSGVTAVCALLDGAPVALVASSFTPVSLEPPLVSLCIAHSSTTWPVLRRSGGLGISVLSAGHSGIVRSMSAKEGDRFSGVEWEAGDGGAVFVHGSTLWLNCEVEREIRAGDHDIVVFRVRWLRPYPETAPMIFHASKLRELARVDLGPRATLGDKDHPAWEICAV